VKDLSRILLDHSQQATQLAEYKRFTHRVRCGAPRPGRIISLCI
jgi:hypothetical protein